MLSVKQGGIKYHFLSLWYDSTWGWTPVSLTVSEHSTHVCTAALLPTKPSSNDDSGFRHGFGAKASLPLTHSTPAVTHDTTKLCWIVITPWDCLIHTGAVRTLFWIFFHVFPLIWFRKSKISQECRGWVGYESLASNLDRKYIGYPAISDTLFSQILIFFQLTLMCPVEIFFKRER